MTHIESIKQEIVPSNTGLTSDLGELKEDILDLVHDTISKMQPPSAFDHLLGAVSAPLQAWMMRKAGINPQTGGALLETIEEMVED